jgi:hypothetical protein
VEEKGGHENQIAEELRETTRTSLEGIHETVANAGADPRSLSQCVLNLQFIASLMQSLIRCWRSVEFKSGSLLRRIEESAVTLRSLCWICLRGTLHTIGAGVFQYSGLSSIQIEEGNRNFQVYDDGFMCFFQGGWSIFLLAAIFARACLELDTPIVKYSAACLGGPATSHGCLSRIHKRAHNGRYVCHFLGAS